MDYIVVVLKGHPYTQHAKEPGKLAAICGKKPGPSRAVLTRSRTGWLAFPPGEGTVNCEKCLAVLLEHSR